ncbi:hypothetical protein ACFXPX_09605 [Kitasatospora sp. NPDC059146]|uniref:hypothetical protein n=1 Tax=unclassified Kitasatospora TaxID=2633591 RepID=UPI003699F3E5
MGTESPPAGAERIYLSDVEPHAAAPIDRASDLRSRVLLHVLFADALLIGDSQSLNNRYFRALVSAEEARQVPWAEEGAELPDLAPLLESGRIRVAVRAGRTLREIRDDHRRRNVTNVPEPGYVARLTAMSAAHAVGYDGTAVAARFKAGVLARIDVAGRHATGGTRTALEDARSWIADQQPFDYKALRDWLDKYRVKDPGSSAELILALQSVDEWAGESYRRALPGVLDVGMAGPRDGSGTLSAARSRRIVEEAGLPAVLLDNLLLSQLPLEVVLEAVEQPSRNALVRELGQVRRGLRPDDAVLRQSVGEFSAWMLEAFERTFRGTDGLAWARLRSETRLMRFRLDEDTVTGRLGVGLEVRGAPLDGARDLSLDVVAGFGAAAPDGDEVRVATGPRRHLDPLHRMITLGG